MDNTEKLLEDMSELALAARWTAGCMFSTHSRARAEYSRLSVEAEFSDRIPGGEYIKDGLFTRTVDATMEYTKEFQDELHDFDKTLMKLIQLRGKLAEQIDIPIGGTEWVRYETYWKRFGSTLSITVPVEM